MKRLAERGSIRPPRRGYLAPCSRCGLEVVHSKATGQPVAQHLNSKACSSSAPPAPPALPPPIAVLAALPRRFELPDMAIALNVARVSVELRLDGTYALGIQPMAYPDFVACDLSFTVPSSSGEPDA